MSHTKDGGTPQMSGNNLPSAPPHSGLPRSRPQNISGAAHSGSDALVNAGQSPSHAGNDRTAPGGTLPVADPAATSGGPRAAAGRRDTNKADARYGAGLPPPGSADPQRPAAPAMSSSKPSRSTSSRGGRQARIEGVTQTPSSIPRQFIAPAPANTTPASQASFGRPSLEGKERGHQAPKAQVDPPREGMNRAHAGQVDPSASAQPTGGPYGPPPNQPGFSRPSGEFYAEPATYPDENRGRVQTNEQSFSKSPGAQKRGPQRSERNGPAGAQQPPPQQPSSQAAPIPMDWSNSRPPGNESTDDARRAMGKSKFAARNQKVEIVPTNETGREDSSDGALLVQKRYQAESGHTNGMALNAMPDSKHQQRTNARNHLDPGPPHGQGTGQKRAPQSWASSSSTAVNTPSSLSSAYPSQPNYATGVGPKRTSGIAPSIQVHPSASSSQSTPLMRTSRRSGSDTSLIDQDGELDAVQVHLTPPAPVLQHKRSASRSRDQLGVYTKESISDQMYPLQDLTPGKHHEQFARGRPEEADYHDLPAHNRGDRLSGTGAEWRPSTESRPVLPRPSNDDYRDKAGLGASTRSQHVQSSYGAPQPPGVVRTVNKQPSFHQPPVIPSTATPPNRRQSPERPQGRELTCSLRCSCCV
ncbi:hypothetical protein BC826DRAFT_1162080 [Russula brevipes]|nr:hypothetical protein BC826DRAFT_1162080 [Russula brevipes]